MAQTIRYVPETRLTLPGTVLILAITAGFTVATGFYSGLLMPVAFVAGSSGLLAVAVELYGSEWRPSARIPLGSLGAIASGALLIYGLRKGAERILPLLEGASGLFNAIFQAAGYTGVLLSVIPISFGVIYSLLESTDKKKMNRSTTSLIYSATVLVPAAAAAAVYSQVSKGTLLKGFNKATETVTSAVMSDSMIGTAVLLVISYITLRLAWQSLPISNLVPEKQVESYRKLSGVETKILLPLTLIFSVAMVVIEMTGIADPTSGTVAGQETATEAIKTLVPILSSPGLKSALALVLAASLTALVFSKTVLKLVRGRGNLTKRLTPYIVFAAIVLASTRAVYISYYEPTINWVLDIPFLQGILTGLEASTYMGAVPQIVSGSAVLLVPGILFTFGIAFLAAARFIPRSEAGNALLSTGIFTAGLASSIAGMNALFLFTSVALSIAAWNIGRTSTGIVEEMGAGSATPGPEIIRAIATLAVAATSIWTGYYLATSLTLPGVAGQRMVASILALIGVLLAVTVIRGLKSGNKEGDYTIDPRGGEGDDGDEKVDDFVESHMEEVDEMIEEGELDEKEKVEKEDEEKKTFVDSAAGLFGPS